MATIAYIEKHSLVERARELGRHALARMQDMLQRHPLVGEVRGLGLLLGIELVRDRATRERATDEAEAVMYSALSKGLSFNRKTLYQPSAIKGTRQRNTRCAHERYIEN